MRSSPVWAPALWRTICSSGSTTVLSTWDQIALEHAASHRANTTVRISGISVMASFTLLFGLVACAHYLAFHGHPELAGVFLAAPLVMVLGTLIPWGRSDGVKPGRSSGLPDKR